MSTEKGWQIFVLANGLEKGVAGKKWKPWLSSNDWVMC